MRIRISFICAANWEISSSQKPKDSNIVINNNDGMKLAI